MESEERREMPWLGRRRFVAAALVTAAGSLALPSRAPAESRGAMLSVNAFVVPSTRIEVVSHAATLDVTADDVRRGTVEVRGATKLSITSTSRNGYRVDVHPRLPIFRSVELRLDGLRAVLGRDGGSLAAPGRSGRRMPARIDYRFELDRDVRAGRYPWPVMLDVRPL
jgi:hypothetical protein